MTKVFVAAPPKTLPPITPHQSYSLSPEAQAIMLKGDEKEEPLTYPIPGKGLYQTTEGASFNFEINLLDSGSKRPIRAVEIKSGLIKGFTDRLGRLIMHLPRGYNDVVVGGHGFVETGEFTPKRVDFDPVALQIDLDSDEIVTVYTSGEIIQGERHDLSNNPGHHGGLKPFDLESFLKQHGVALGLIGAAGVTMYFLGKSRNATK